MEGLGEAIAARSYKQGFILCFFFFLFNECFYCLSQSLLSEEPDK